MSYEVEWLVQRAVNEAEFDDIDFGVSSDADRAQKAVLFKWAPRIIVIGAEFWSDANQGPIVPGEYVRSNYMLSGYRAVYRSRLTDQRVYISQEELVDELGWDFTKVLEW